MTLISKITSSLCRGVSVAALLFVTVNTPVWAQSNDVVETTPQQNVEEETTNLLSASIGLSLRSSTANPKESDYALGLFTRASVTYDFGAVGSLEYLFRGYKQLNQDYLWRVIDSSLSYSIEHEVIQDLKVNYSASYGLPLAKESLRYEHSKGSIGGSVGAEYKIYLGVVKTNTLTLTYSLGYDRYLYDFKSDDGGGILNMYAITQNYGVSYTPIAKLTASVAFTNISAWDFNGNKQDDNFLHVETVAYALNNHWSLSVGHINDGNTYDYGGQGNNVRIYDNYRSQVFVGSKYSF